MGWYAAHIVTYVKFRDGIQETYPLWENIVLIEARTDDEAIEEAERLGHECYDRPEREFLHNGRPATWAFAGIRKVIECQDNFWQAVKQQEVSSVPGHGTEITYLELEVDSKEALEQLVQGEPVTVVYEE